MSAHRAIVAPLRSVVAVAAARRISRRPQTCSSRLFNASSRSSPSSALLVVRGNAGLGGAGLRQRRNHSATAGFPSDIKSKMYGFEDVKKLSEGKDYESNIMLIDVREPDEYNAGSIPTAYNLPITSHPDALLLPPAEFEQKFQFPKPPPSKELVFYCKAGVRSAAAAQLAKQGGYGNVGEYRGSWLDWVRNGGMTSTGINPPGMGKTEGESQRVGEGWEKRGGIGGVDDSRDR